jgi:hypothetical protein
MGDPVDSLVLDLLEWVAVGGRPYDEAMELWRTSCPRLPVWEDANALGYVRCGRGDDGVRRVSLTGAGRAHLAASRPDAVAPSPAATR